MWYVILHLQTSFILSINFRKYHNHFKKKKSQKNFLKRITNKEFVLFFIHTHHYSLVKTLEGLLDIKEIKPANPKGNKA